MFRQAFDTLKRSRWYVRNMLHQLFSRPGEHSTAAKVACFDLHENVFHRYLLDFMLMLRDQGYDIRLRHRYRALATWNTHLLLRYVPGLRIYHGEVDREECLLFTDRPALTKGILLDPNYFDPASPGPDTYILPMPMVDSIYTKGLHRWTPDLDSIDRRKKVFFAGNLNADYEASAEDLQVLFGCLSRHQVIRSIRSRFSQRVHAPQSASELFSDLPADIILVDRRSYNIPHEDLRPTLARHDFFLSTAGVIMPLCHNIVEAMSVGCVPILQHASQFHPPLERGIHCLSFNDEDGLARILEDLPAMPDEEVLRMRHNALAYYHDHLSPAAVVGRIEAERRTLRRIRMNAEHYSVALLRAHHQALRGTSAGPKAS